MAVSVPKRHHYVPESYQKLFWDSASEKIFFLDKKDGEVKGSNPKNLCVEKDLYTIESPLDGISPTEIENPLLSNLDGRYTESLKSLISGHHTDEHRQTISVFLAFLRCRTPSFMDGLKESASSYIQKELFEKIRDSEVSSALAISVGIDVSDYNSFADSLSSVAPTINKDGLLTGFLACSIQMSFWIAFQNWRIILSDEGNFVTSDKPFTLVDEEIDESGNLRRICYVPLSSHSCLELGACNESLLIERANNCEIEEINSAIAYCSERWILGRDKAILQSAYSGSKMHN